MENTEPIATGYVAPIHGRGAMGFLLVGLLGLLVMLAGLLAPDMALFIFTRKILAGEPIDEGRDDGAHATRHVHGDVHHR